MKKGFTLVELLAVLVIIGLISTLSLTNIAKKADQMNEISNIEFNSLMKASVISYLSDNNNIKNQIIRDKIYPITFKQLHESGYLNESIYDFFTKANISVKDYENYCVCVNLNKSNYTYAVVKTIECVLTN